MYYNISIYIYNYTLLLLLQSTSYGSPACMHVYTYESGSAARVHERQGLGGEAQIISPFPPGCFLTRYLSEQAPSELVPSNTPPSPAGGKLRERRENVLSLSPRV